MIGRRGQIVILNGPPRSGKSSIARELQHAAPGVWMNLGVDGFMAMTPERVKPGIGLRPGGDRPDLEPAVRALFLALFDSIAAHARRGVHVVADVGLHDAYSQTLELPRRCMARLRGLSVLFVGVRCSDETLLSRRLAGGWDRDRTEAEARDLVRAWQRAVHDAGGYDLVLDTDELSPAACAQRIIARLASR